ncbi:hypothetical protein [Synechococcus sp. PCC 7336]|uniref:hypothetical protein n=1 Tax=Synechococcus sp. PCC 7336 TaxID=195250 RepID=UPI000A044D35|nr:hypothetical protein [Synechococcus sp. PCC 7336]
MHETVLPAKSSALAIADVSNYAIHLMHTGRSSLSVHLSEGQTKLAQLLSQIAEGIDPAKVWNAAVEIASYCVVVGEMAHYTWLKHDELVASEVEVVVKRLCCK